MRFLQFLFFLFITNCLSQKEYHFDYFIEYELTTFKDSTYLEGEKIKKFYLTNSKENSYYSVLIDKDSLNYQLSLKDNNGIISKVLIYKESFNKVEFINIKCDLVKKWHNPYKHQTKHYDFYKLNDTVINNVSHGLYKIASNKPKRKKRKKLGEIYYIVDNSLNFQLPIFLFSTAYEEWKLNKTIPNGPYLERLVYNFDEKIYSKEKLLNYSKIRKTIVIPEKCNYTDKKNDLRNRVKIIYD